jgi:uncharacterized membrane protein YbhN (UPF0104 family)
LEEVGVNLRKTSRIVIPSLLFLITALYFSRLIPEIDLDTISLLTYQKWLLVLLLFFIVQCLNLWYFKLILTRMYNIHSSAKLFQILFASHSFNYAGPVKLGMPVRIFLFKQILGVPYSAGIATVMTTTGLDVCIMIALVTALFTWIYISPLVGLILGLAIIIGLTGLTALSHKLSFIRLERFAWLARFLTDIRNLSPFVTFCAMLLSATKLLLNSMAGWIVLAGLGGATGLAKFSLVYFASHLAGLLSFIPMGLGVKDASVVELLGRMNTPPSMSIAFIAIDRLVWSVIPLLIGLLAGWQLGISAMIDSARENQEAL